MKKKKKKDVKVRKSWGNLDPTTKIIPDKRTNYNRIQAKRNFIVEMDEELDNEFDNEDWLDDEFRFEYF